MHIAFTIVFFALSFGASAQKLSPAVQRYVDTLAKYDLLEECSGIGRSVGYEYSTFIKLSTVATTPELLQLLQHKSPIVKTYASWALADRKYSGITSLYTQISKTDDPVAVLSGCMVMRHSVSDLFYMRVHDQAYCRRLNKADSLFFDVQTRKLGALIMRGKTVPPWTMTLVWEANHADPATYNDVKKAALNYNPEAVLALAEYRKPADTTIILRMNFYAFPAIAVFPHPSFWRHILLYADTCRATSYLNAIAAYKTPNALALMYKIYNNGRITDDAAHHLAQALSQNHIPFYTSLLSSLWTTNCVTTASFIKQLIKDDPVQANKVFAAGLLTGKIPKDAYDNSDLAKYTLFPLLLSAIADKPLLEKICLKYIAQAKDPADVGPVMNYVSKNKVDAAIPVLTTRLNNAKNASEMGVLVNCLLAYKRPDITENVKKYLVSKRSIWDKDNSAVMFQRLFKEYNITL